MTRSISIRTARIEDASRLADLAGQLGYPSTSGQVAARLDPLLSNPDHSVFVAELPEDGVVGWTHVFVHRVVEAETRAELAGLVVDERHRSAGVGRALMEAVETWARGRRCDAVTLRSNVIRDRAHEFYRRLGYAQVKTQHAFRKKL